MQIAPKSLGEIFTRLSLPGILVIASPGENFDDNVLEYGASRDGLEMLQEYLGGRLPDPKALLSILQPVEVNEEG